MGERSSSLTTRRAFRQEGLRPGPGEVVFDLEPLERLARWSATRSTRSRSPGMSSHAAVEGEEGLPPCLSVRDAEGGVERRVGRTDPQPGVQEDEGVADRLDNTLCERTHSCCFLLNP